MPEDLKKDFIMRAKELEDSYLLIEYQGKSYSLQEILFKSLFYSSVTDLFVYLQSQDATLTKINRASFLLLITKAKLNLKAVEEVLLDAIKNFNSEKPIEESVEDLKNKFDAIDKIFND